MKERKACTDEFRRNTIRWAEERSNVCAAARDLGIAQSLIPKWRKKLEEHPDNPFPGNGNPQDPEPAKLQCENARLKEEVEILKCQSGWRTLWLQRQLISSAVARCEMPIHSRAWHSLQYEPARQLLG